MPREIIAIIIEAGWVPRRYRHASEEMIKWWRRNQTENFYYGFSNFDYDGAVLDPEFWNALSKACGWKEKSGIFIEPGGFELTGAWSRAHMYLDGLFRGDDVTIFWKDIIQQYNEQKRDAEGFSQQQNFVKIL